MRKFIVHLKSIIVTLYPMLVLTVFLTMPGGLYAQNADINIPKGWEQDPPVLSSLIDFTKSESNLRVAVKRYVEDPLVHGLSTASHAAALIDQIERVRGRGAEVEIPMFVTHGALDRLCPPTGSMAFHQSLPGTIPGSSAPHAAFRMYERSYHEILNDVEREQVMTDMLDWIECREKTSRLYAIRRH